MKKIISLALCGCVITGAFAAYSVFAKTKTTISDWAEETVNSAIADGIVPESITSELDYTENVNRLQFSELIYKTFEETGKVTQDKSLKTPFTDVDNNAITCLYTDGIIAGKGDNKFAPEDNLTREEASTILGRAIKAYTNALPETSTSAKFTDDATIHDWAYEFVYLMKDAKILEGFEDGAFRPLNNMSKEEAIVVAERSRNAAGLAISAEDEVIDDLPAPETLPEPTEAPVEDSTISVNEPTEEDAPPVVEEIDYEEDYIPPLPEEFNGEDVEMPTLEELLREDGLIE